MSLLKILKHFHLAHFSKPTGERSVYKAVQKYRPRRIVELGIGSGERTHRLLKFATEMADGKVQFTGQDLFEGRSDGQCGLKLKEAHQLFATQNVSARLAPGDVLSVLSRMANSLTDTDLLLISNDHESSAIDAAWYYVPRMLHDRSLVLVQEPGDEGMYRLVDAKVIEQRASEACRPHRAAA